MITVDTLKKFAPSIKTPEVHAAALENARINSSVMTPRRLCHFLGQIFVETGGFTSMVENLIYRNLARGAAIGEKNYAGGAWLVTGCRVVQGAHHAGSGP